MEKKLGECFKDVCSYKTLGVPKFLVVRPMVESKKIFADDKQEYRLGVGMLLYLVKHLHPNLANRTRELWKTNNGANPAAFKELLCVIKYLDMKNLGLKIEHTGNSNEPWEIICYSDGNAGDPVSRRSISGFVLCLLGILVSW